MQHQKGSHSYKIITQYGDMLVIKQASGNSNLPVQQATNSSSFQSVVSAGNQQQQQQQQQQQPQSRPVIMTFHDLGLNSELQFASFCECEEVKLMLQTFTVLHVNFIGQELDADRLSNDFNYPSVEQLAECIVDVCAHLRVRSFIGLAVGAGAHIASLLALLRPDLVDGLFLINPVVASCSITEWLYFKMSAIASNHHHPHPHHHDHHHQQQHNNQQQHDQHGKHQQYQSSTQSPAHSSVGETEAATPSNLARRSGREPKQSSSGLRRLLNAASSHLHMPHLAHTSESPPLVSCSNVGAAAEESAGFLTSSSSPSPHTPEPPLDADYEGDEQVEQEERASPDSRSLASSCSVSTTPSHSKPTSGSQSGGSRLRRLILSRNFRLGGRQQQQGGMTADSPPSSGGDGTSPSPTGRKLSAASSGSSTGSQRSLTPSGKESADPSGGSRDRRAPYEYLMYHHFGPSTFQRYHRRNSGCQPAKGSPKHNKTSGRSSRPTEAGGPSSGSGLLASPAHSLHSVERAEEAPLAVEPEVPTKRSASNQLSRLRATTCGRSHDSLAAASATAASVVGHSTQVAGQAQAARRLRSGSLCLSSSHLAAFSSERHKQAYMHSVYRHYFGQLNAHNLWLFAQTFAKRKALNLRRDCGAAAHAAAAAAALGTSICTALVGTGVGVAHANSSGSGTAVSSSSARNVVQSAGPMLAGAAGGGSSGSVTGLPQTGSNRTLQISSRQVTAANFAPQQQQADQPRNNKALVAGTKVRRTLTCQTLIMCSSVQMHCERAFKLMSLLNPLQATWIKTDQLLVLEEKPEKVCQALRLFLQGIGYSMSTYERRLRLSSTTDSAGSNDSSGSMPSLNNER